MRICQAHRGSVLQKQTKLQPVLSFRELRQAISFLQDGGSFAELKQKSEQERFDESTQSLAKTAVSVGKISAMLYRLSPTS